MSIIAIEWLRFVFDAKSVLAKYPKVTSSIFLLASLILSSYTIFVSSLYFSWLYILTISTKISFYVLLHNFDNVRQKTHWTKKKEWTYIERLKIGVRNAHTHMDFPLLNRTSTFLSHKLIYHIFCMKYNDSCTLLIYVVYCSFIHMQMCGKRTV